MPRNILLFGEAPVAERLAVKLAALPETYVVRGVPQQQIVEKFDVAIICERTRNDAQLWRTHPLIQLDSWLGYLYNALFSVQAYEVPHLITIGNVCEYSEHVALPYIPELLWDGAPDGRDRGAVLRLMANMTNLYNEAGHLSHHIILDSLYGDETCYNDTASVIPALIYRFTEALHNNHDIVTVNSDGAAARTFLHIDDAIDGIIAVMNNGQHYPGIINHGGDQQITVDKLATIIKNFVGYVGEVVYDSSQPGGRIASKMDCSLLHDGIGFKPVKRLIAGLEEATRNYRQKFST